MARRQDGVDTVELNEITNVGGDPELAYGSLGGTNAVVPFNQGIQFLAAGAKANAEADQFKYLQFQQNLKDYYTKFNELDVNGVREQDAAIINEEYAALAKEIANSYDVLRNPTKDLEKFGMLKEKEANLRGKISKSKQLLSYRDKHIDWMKQNPGMNTKENQAVIEDFNQKSLDEAQPFTLRPSMVYNPVEISKIAMERALQEIKNEKDTGQWLETTDEKTYLRDKYLAAANQLVSAQDAYGRPVYEAAVDSYKKLKWIQDESQFQPVFEKTMLDLLGQNQTTSSMKADPFALQDDQQKFEAAQQAKRLAAQKELAEDKTFKGYGRLYAETWATAFTNGYVDPELAQRTWGSDDEIEVVVKTGDQYSPTGTTEKKTKVPKITAKSGGKDANGNLIIERFDNEKKVPLPSITITPEEGRQAFYNIAGKNNARAVAAESQKYLEDEKIGKNVTLEPLQELFKLKQTGNKKLVYNSATGKYE